MAVPMEGAGWQASVDDVRALVDAVHEELHEGGLEPLDDYFLNLLGTARLGTRAPQSLKHLTGREAQERASPSRALVILAAYKIRQPHIDALAAVAASGAEPICRLAQEAAELGKAALCGCRSVLSAEVRGGAWCWTGDVSCHEAVAQEEMAWMHLGATPRWEEKVLRCEEALAQLVEKHGGDDPKQWRWGTEVCSDVFQADEAARKFSWLQARAEALRRICGARERESALRASRQDSRDRSRSRGRTRAPAASDDRGEEIVR